MFREYDIRGEVGTGENLNKKTFLVLGKAVGTFFMKRNLKTITLGHDNRRTSPEFHRAFLKGITSTGCNIIDVGMVPTPVLYFSVILYKADAGCMITASHTPPNYNGLKITI